LALPAYIKLGCKGLAEIHTLAYYENSQIVNVKSFITLRPYLPTRLEKLALDKHTSLFGPLVNYGCKKFYDIVSWSSLVTKVSSRHSSHESNEENSFEHFIPIFKNIFNFWKGGMKMKNVELGCGSISWVS
jgi:hypothetical protein